MSTLNKLQSKYQGERASDEQLKRSNKAYRVFPTLKSGDFTKQYKHAPRVKVGNDAGPEFHAKTLQPGTSPHDHTFEPNAGPSTDRPANSNPQKSEETRVSSADTTVSATSADVHRGIG